MQSQRADVEQRRITLGNLPFLSRLLPWFKRLFTRQWIRLSYVFREREESATIEAGRIHEQPTRIRGKLRAIKGRFTPPRPEITLFRLGPKTFHPLSTQEGEELHDGTYYASLASFYSAGENIARALKKATNPPYFSMQGSEVYSLLPTPEEILYVGKMGVIWLFSIKTEKFPRERLSIPEDRTWEEYTFDQVKMCLDHQIDQILGETDGELLYLQLAEICRVAYQTMQSLMGSIGDGFAAYLIKTPRSRLSPFIMIRIEAEDDQITSNITPVWVNYTEAKVIRAAERVKKSWKPPSAPLGVELEYEYEGKALTEEEAKAVEKIEQKVKDVPRVTVEDYNVTSLNLQGTSISNLTPLKNLTHLHRLNLSNTDVSRIKPLSKLKKLSVLDLDHTDISNLTPLKNLTNLQELSLDHTDVSNLAPLKNLTSLQVLTLDHTDISNLTPLKNLTNLQELSLRGVKITALTPLKNLTNLQELSLRDTNVSHIDPLGDLERLQELDLSHTTVTELSPLRGLKGLRWLNLSYTEAFDLAPLSELESLEILNLRSSNVIDFAPLLNLENLKTLDLREMYIFEILDPMIDFTALELTPEGTGNERAREFVQILKTLEERGVDLYM